MSLLQNLNYGMVLALVMMVTGCEKADRATSSAQGKQADLQAMEAEQQHARLQQHPGDVGLLLEMGTKYLETGKAAEALECFSRAMIVNPDDPEILMGKISALDALGRSKEAEDMLESVFQKNPTPKSYKFVRARAQLQLRSGKPQEALKSIEKAIEINSESTRNFLVKGQILEALGRGEEAGENFAKAFQFEPYSRDVYTAYISHLIRMRNHVKALEVIDLTMSQNGEEPVLLLLKGAVLRNSGKVTEGNEYIEKAVKLQPELKERMQRGKPKTLPERSTE